MKQKTKQINKQEIKQKINSKKEELIKLIELAKKTEQRINKKTQKLVIEIIDLERILDPNYSLSHFFQEKEIEDYTDFIEDRVPYDVIPEVQILYNKGKIDNTDLMVLSNMPKKFQEPKRQRELVRQIVTKKIKSKELISKSDAEVYDILGEKGNKMNEQAIIILECAYRMEAIARNITKYKDDFKKILDKKLKKKLIDNFCHLKNAIQFGLKVKLK